MATTCSSCGAEIVWAFTEAWKKMPLDAEPAPDGNIAVLEVLGHKLARVLRDGENVVGAVRYTSHFATCPNADQHRKVA